MAIHAASQNKFWQMNDILFEMGQKSDVIDIRELAAPLGMDPEALARLVNDPAARQLLQHDILSSLKIQISGTPAYVINENVYLEQIPSQIIKTALADWRVFSEGPSFDIYGAASAYARRVGINLI